MIGPGFSVPQLVGGGAAPLPGGLSVPATGHTWRRPVRRDDPWERQRQAAFDLVRVILRLAGAAAEEYAASRPRWRARLSCWRTGWSARSRTCLPGSATFPRAGRKAT